jgi:S-(hydroxymethyl)glutathione dehydrogenase/alcohol dehydrogenase
VVARLPSRTPAAARKNAGTQAGEACQAWCSVGYPVDDGGAFDQRVLDVARTDHHGRVGQGQGVDDFRRVERHQGVGAHRAGFERRHAHVVGGGLAAPLPVQIGIFEDGHGADRFHRLEAGVDDDVDGDGVAGYGKLHGWRGGKRKIRSLLHQILPFPAELDHLARMGAHNGRIRCTHPHPTKDRPMKTKAAIAWRAGTPLTIEEVDLAGPRAGEVLVELKATGICHTDYYTLSGADPEGIFPAILGHEGAGIVVDVGPGVTSLRKDDHVIPLYTPECRQCKFCLSQKTNLCQAIRSTQGRGLMPDATSRFSLDGKPLFHYMGTSTFSNYIVVPEIALAKIREDAPFDKVCYIGCGVTTGVGAVLFSAKVEAGANVVVFGLGGIGLNVIQAAKMVGADKIIGVDINPARQAMARKFGMTHFINPKDVENVVDAIVQITDGGADYSFECIGNTATMRQALECTHKGWGKSFIIGVAAAGEEISTRPFQLVTGREWRGSAFGGARGRTDVPKIVDWYMEGKLNIDDLITHRLPLERINEGFDLMKSGESIRSVVLY